MMSLSLSNILPLLSIVPDIKLENENISEWSVKIQRQIVNTWWNHLNEKTIRGKYKKKKKKG